MHAGIWVIYELLRHPLLVSFCDEDVKTIHCECFRRVSIEECCGLLVCMLFELLALQGARLVGMKDMFCASFYGTHNVD